MSLPWVRLVLAPRCTSRARLSSPVAGGGDPRGRGSHALRVSTRLQDGQGEVDGNRAAEVAMPDWVPLSAVIGVLLVLAQMAVYVVALGVIPGGRKPSTGMAWLILILAVPFFGLLAFLLFGSTRVERKRHSAAGRGQPADPRSARPRSPTSTRATPELGLRGPVAVLNRQLGALPAVRGQHRRAVLRTTRSRSPRWPRPWTTARDLRARGVLHHRLGRRDGAVLRGPGPRHRAGRPVRLLFDHLGSRGIPGYKDMLARLERDHDRVAPDAADRAAAREVPAPRPPQPPQDPRRRRHVSRFAGLAEPDRAVVQQAEEPAGRAAPGSS